jgi:ankyrin repeat protein
MDKLDEDNIPQVDDIVSFCAGLVTVDEESNIIRLVHYTTQEYLERKKSDWFPNAESSIAQTCIVYLSFTIYRECCLYCPKPEDLPFHDFYKYASLYWGDHARIIGRKLNKVVLKFLMSGTKASNACFAMFQRLRLRPPYIDSQWEYDYDHLSMSGLHLAVHFVLDEAINLLLKNGCDINGVKGAIVTPLLLAIHIGHIGIAEMLLDNGATTSSAPMFWNAAMKLKNCDARFSFRLVKKGLLDEVHIGVILQSAVRNGHEVIVKALLSIGADIDEKTDWGHTPLHSAVLSQNKAIVKLLLDKGANFEASCISSYTPLHAAVQFQNAAIVNLLLDKGANLEASCSSSYTPLHLAVQFQNAAIVNLLLAKGANLEASCSSSYTPLHSAARKANAAIINILIKNGANTEALDDEGCTPLLSAVYNSFRENECDLMAAIGVLLRNGANIEAVNNKGYTAFLLAAECGREAVFDLLIKSGANVHAITYGGQAPLHLATQNFRANVIDRLLEMGANIEEVDSDGRTPLLFAVQRNRERKGTKREYHNELNTIRLLLQKGADFNKADNEGRTPLPYDIIERWSRLKVLRY